MWAKGAIEVLLEIILLRNTSLRLRSVDTELMNKHTLREPDYWKSERENTPDVLETQRELAGTC